MLSVKTESLMIENAYLAEANVQMSPAGRSVTRMLMESEPSANYTLAGPEPINAEVGPSAPENR